VKSPERAVIVAQTAIGALSWIRLLIGCHPAGTAEKGKIQPIAAVKTNFGGFEIMAFSEFKNATPQNLGNAPERAGVYQLYQGSECIYIGRAGGGNSTIRTRLRAHKNGNEGPCTKGFTRYRYDTTVADVTVERRLLQNYKQKNGRLPKCNERLP